MKRERPSTSRWTAVPAAMAIVLCLGLTAYVGLAGAEPNVAALRTKAASAMAAGQHSAAALHYQHLLALEPDQPSHAFDLAVALDRLKRRPEAITILSMVAPLTGGGYGPAHLKLAEWAVESRVLGGQLNDAELDHAIQHAQAAKASVALREQAETLIDILHGMKTPSAMPPTTTQTSP